MSILIAFFGGVFSFFSPCVLPLIPSYIMYMAGITLQDLPQGRNRKRVVINTLLFILGFSLVFVLLGAAASLIGRVLFHYRQGIEIAAGILVIIMGFYLLGVFRIKFLDIERKLHFIGRPIGYLNSFMLGMAFAAGWTPCVGPILASILTLAGTSKTLGEGMLLLSFYSLGLGIPFLLCSLMLDLFSVYLAKFGKYIGAVNFISGIFLILVGLLILF